MTMDTAARYNGPGSGSGNGPGAVAGRPTTSELLHGRRAGAGAAPGAGGGAGGADRRGRLELLNIHKDFSTRDGAPAPALKDISLTIKPGEFVVVVGPSGCGKSTLLNIAAGMLRPDSGKVVLDGQGVWAPGPKLAMVFQDHALFPWLTAAQNIEFGLKMAGVPKGE